MYTCALRVLLSSNKTAYSVEHPDYLLTGLVGEGAGEVRLRIRDVHQLGLADTLLYICVYGRLFYIYFFYASLIGLYRYTLL